MSRRGPKEVTVRIESLDAAGSGHAVFTDGEDNERAVQAKNALPGEQVSVRILKRRGGIWHGEAVTPETDGSPLRIKPACSYFPRCGGCAMQHLNYQAQLELKQQQLHQALTLAGVSPVMFNAPVYGPRLGYRTKARLGVRQVAGQILIGFRETLSNRVGRMDACETLIAEFSALLPQLKALISALRQPDRIPQIEIAAGDSSRALIIRHLDPLDASDRLQLQVFAEQHRVAVFLQSAGYDTIEALHADQSPYLGYANIDFGLYYHFLPWDFTQVNLQMNRYLVRAALGAFGTPAEGRLVDLFCGIGNFSLAAARLGWDVIGIEAAAESVARARGNAVLNGLASRCEFRVADLYDPGSDLAGACDYLLLDPPRSGAGPNLARWIETLQPSKLVYVSCQPSTFATDAAILQRSGYQLDQVGIFDMFPNTAHVETLGSFSRQW